MSMAFNRDNPSTWGCFKPPLLAHDVARSRDRSTAVIGGNCPIGSQLLGISELIELPQGLYGAARADALAVIDRRYDSDALIIVDVSNDESYAEVLFDMFGGTRLIGLHITRSGDGMNWARRPVKHGSFLVYTIGRTHLLEKLQTALLSDQVKFVDGPMSRRAYEQLVALETEMRESGTVYRCPSGQHDDLGISCAMLNWAAQHPHLPLWLRELEHSRTIRKPRPEQYGWGAFT
jgi:hypothetical protein